MTKKSDYIAPSLHDFGGDLSKKWYIEYSVLDLKTGKKKRMRYSEGINTVDDLQQRTTYCKKVMMELEKKIIRHELPCQSSEKVEYTDELLYDSTKRLFGNKRISKVTIRTYLSEFLSRKQQEVIAHSYTTYKSKLRIFADWCEEKSYTSIYVGDWTNEMVCDFFRFIYNKNHVSRRTIVKYKQILYNFFDYLKYTKGIIERNPVYNIPRIGDVVDEAPVPIPVEVMQRLHDYMVVTAPQLWLVCLMQFYCAIRPGQELRLMKIGDINFDGHFIVIRKDLAKNRQRESVDIPDQLYNDMINIYHLNDYPVNYYVFGKEGVPGIEHLGKNTFRYRFDCIRENLNLSSMYKLYSFKHSGAVALINSGFNTQELQRHFRHKSISTTEHYFRKNIGEHNEKLIKQFPNIIKDM